MRWVVKVVADGKGGENRDRTIATIERGCELRLEELGLTLQEGKEVLAALQRVVVTTQVQEHGSEVRRCDRCERRLRTQGYYRAFFRSAFGNVSLRVRRLVVCPCLHLAKRTFSELGNHLGHRRLVAPEWLYLEAKCASLIPFEKVAALLGEVLPVEDGRNAETVRNRLGKVGQRLHQEKIQSELARASSVEIEGGLGETECIESPSQVQTIVGLDGCYVRNRHPDPRRTFEVIAGRVQGPTGNTRCLAWVRDSESHAHEVHEAVLRVGGHPPSVTILTDGDSSLRGMVGPMNHVLDWFHLGMRFQVLTETVRGLPMSLGLTRDWILKAIKSAKWHLWHGNLWHGHQNRALQLLDMAHRSTSMGYVVKADPSANRIVRKRMGEMLALLRNNVDSLPCYRSRYKLGLPIATSPVESTVNQVVSRRMVKKLQIRWTKGGAQRLLQVRTEVLNGTLEDVFRGWYPRFREAA